RSHPLIRVVVLKRAARYTRSTHQPDEYKRRTLMLCCELFDYSHHFGDRQSSGITGIVLR
ncbi:MAG: hypothetical protein E6Z45_10010, partial [Cronobacter sakazakii]|nr:hypothetical protein [Cronobacter sakazakii]